MKKVVWGTPKVLKPVPKGGYSSMKEKLAKANALRLEQELAQQYLQTIKPALQKVLEFRLAKGEPLIVMRPLRYQTSLLKSQMEDEIDRSFYNQGSSQNENDSFVDVMQTINPGTRLVLKSLDPNLREFIFKDGEGREHPISYDDQNKLLTQTDIFETVREYLSKQETK